MGPTCTCKVDLSVYHLEYFSVQLPLSTRQRRQMPWMEKEFGSLYNDRNGVQD